jgi:hypothetical protein
VHFQTELCESFWQNVVEAPGFVHAFKCKNQESRPRESHPQPLAELSVTLSRHSAPLTQPWVKAPSANEETTKEMQRLRASASAQHVAYDDIASCIFSMPTTLASY